MAVTGTIKFDLLKRTAVSTVSTQQNYENAKKWHTFGIVCAEFDVWRDCLSFQSEHALDETAQPCCSFTMADVGFNLFDLSKFLENSPEWAEPYTSQVSSFIAKDFRDG